MARKTTPRRPIFDPSALDDQVDNLPFGSRTAPSTPPVVQSDAATLPVASSSQSVHDTPQKAVLESAGTVPAPAPPPANQPSGGAGVIEGMPASVIPAATRRTNAQTRPPEVILSIEVYERLVKAAAAEKRAKRGASRRPFGIIVLDALDRHRERLASAWRGSQASEVPAPGSMFIRPTSTAVPARRRHVNPPRTVALAGITGANSAILDDCVTQWGSGTRSALVEQALRYEFAMSL